MDENKPKENSEIAAHKKCICSNLQGLFIPNRQLSVAVSAGIMMLFFSFVGGYFFGGQHAAQDFMYQVDHVSFNDQMSASLCALAKECTVTNAPENQDATTGKDSTIQEHVCNDVDNAIVAEVVEIKENESKYYAQLIGFGTQQAAKRFAKKLESRQIPVEINKHSSRTAQGKTINWYQVVTTPYNNRQELLDLVDTIQKAEKIQDARIIAC